MNRILDGKLRNAVNNGEYQRVQDLLRRGADPNALNKHRYTALHLAVGNSHLQVVELLLQTGASYSIKPEGRLSPLVLAAAQQKANVLEVMLAASQPTPKELATCLWWAVSGFDERLVDLLLRNGASPSSTDSRGKTLLQEARDWCDEIHPDMQAKGQRIIKALEEWQQPK